MAKLYVVSVFDRSMQAYMRPAFVAHPALAVRSFTDEINREAPAHENPLYSHPEDFDLMQLAVFDEETGAFAPDVCSLARGSVMSERSRPGMVGGPVRGPEVP